jgi:hypothetical protein
VEFSLWFSADEELAVGRLHSKTLANKQSKLSAEILDVVWATLADFADVAEQNVFKHIAVDRDNIDCCSCTEGLIQCIYAAPSCRAGSCGGTPVSIMLFM